MKQNHKLFYLYQLVLLRWLMAMQRIVIIVPKANVTVIPGTKRLGESAPLRYQWHLDKPSLYINIGPQESEFESTTFK